MEVANDKSIQLTQEPEIVTWPEMRYVYIEKTGNIPVIAPQAWQEFLRLTSSIAEHNQIMRRMSLYKLAPQVYRAGVCVATEPANLPDGLQYEKFPGGKYSRFVLTGPYSNLPEASRRVFEIVSERKIQLRDDYCIENYVTDPRTTPEEKLITEILIPTA